MISRNIKKINEELKRLEKRKGYATNIMTTSSICMRKEIGNELTEAYTIGINMIAGNRLQGDFNSIVSKKTTYINLLTKIRENMLHIMLQADINDRDKMIISDIITNTINDKIRHAKPRVEYVLNASVEDIKKIVKNSMLSNNLKRHTMSMLDYALQSQVTKKLNAQTNKQLRLMSKVKTEEKKKEKSIEDITRQERYKLVENFAKETIGDDYHKYVQISMNANRTYAE